MKSPAAFRRLLAGSLHHLPPGSVAISRRPRDSTSISSKAYSFAGSVGPVIRIPSDKMRTFPCNCAVARCGRTGMKPTSPSSRFVCRDKVGKTYTKTIAALLVAFASLAAPIAPAHAAIDAQNLGAKYNATKTEITFRVYSSRATRIELDLYALNYGAPAVAKYVLTEDASDVWSVTVPVSALQSAGINGPVFYG